MKAPFFDIYFLAENQFLIISRVYCTVVSASDFGLGVPGRSHSCVVVCSDFEHVTFPQLLT